MSEPGQGLHKEVHEKPKGKTQERPKKVRRERGLETSYCRKTEGVL